MLSVKILLAIFVALFIVAGIAAFHIAASLALEGRRGGNSRLSEEQQKADAAVAKAVERTLRSLQRKTVP